METPRSPCRRSHISCFSSRSGVTVIWYGSSGQSSTEWYIATHGTDVRLLVSEAAMGEPSGRGTYGTEGGDDALGAQGTAEQQIDGGHGESAGGETGERVGEPRGGEAPGQGRRQGRRHRPAQLAQHARDTDRD